MALLTVIHGWPLNSSATSSQIVWIAARPIRPPLKPETESGESGVGWVFGLHLLLSKLLLYGMESFGKNSRLEDTETGILHLGCSCILLIVQGVC